jgi:hypothetical protein
MWLGLGQTVVGQRQTTLFPDFPNLFGGDARHKVPASVHYRITETKLIANRLSVGVKRIHCVDKHQCSSCCGSLHFGDEQLEAIPVWHRADVLAASFSDLPSQALDTRVRSGVREETEMLIKIVWCWAAFLLQLPANSAKSQIAGCAPCPRNRANAARRTELAGNIRLADGTPQYHEVDGLPPTRNPRAPDGLPPAIVDDAYPQIDNDEGGALIVPASAAHNILNQPNAPESAGAIGIAKVQFWINCRCCASTVRISKTIGGGPFHREIGGRGGI